MGFPSGPTYEPEQTEGELAVRPKDFQSNSIPLGPVDYFGTHVTRAYERGFYRRAITSDGVTEAGPVIEACIPLIVWKRVVDTIHASKACRTGASGNPSKLERTRVIETAERNIASSLENRFNPVW